MPPIPEEFLTFLLKLLKYFLASFVFGVIFTLNIKLLQFLINL